MLVGGRRWVANWPVQQSEGAGRSQRRVGTAVRHFLRQSWRPWAGRGSAHTAGMELRDKRRNEQLARSGAGTASCGHSGDQIELVYGVDRDGTLWAT